ncbi:MAG TPA: GcrA family cell cycle regulator, partial [Bradyrhizobium sp.]|nr:GcrA family cell cycle regulator [Bradyrhizobium sp.]
MTHRATVATWTPERVEQLRTCVVNGLTCSQIAAEIGVTRNAIIGKIHRLGLKPLRSPGTPARTCPPRAAPPSFSQRKLLRLMFAEAPSLAAEQANEPAGVESTQRCSLLELAVGKCRWPVADPVGDHTGAVFVFCGNEAVRGFSYCVGHARMAYRLPARQRA